MLKERQSIMGNGRLNANIPKNFFESELEAKLKKASNDKNCKGEFL